VEQVLIGDARFHLPGKKTLLKSDAQYEVVLVDVTETSCKRPKKQSRNYSGKKKCHIIKMQVVVDKLSGKIICTAFSEGKKHDFKLFLELMCISRKRLRLK
jgi:hypothetical protein